MKTISLIDLPSDWLRSYRERKRERHTKAITDKHRKRYLRQKHSSQGMQHRGDGEAGRGP